MVVGPGAGTTSRWVRRKLLTRGLPISTVGPIERSREFTGVARLGRDSVRSPTGGSVRRERDRDAVVDAIMVLIQAGETQPAMADVAQLAGVSERSIFRHFESREALLAAVIERQVEVVSGLLREIPPTGPLAGRITAFVNERPRLYEEITPCAGPRSTSSRSPTW